MSRDTTVQSVAIDRCGPPDELHVVERAVPVPGPGEVLVSVEAAGVTFVETQIRAGGFRPRGMPELEFPAVLGNGVAGRIADVGDGVSRDRIGDPAVTSTGGLGGYSSHVVVPETAPLGVPAGISPPQAVALLADGRTALAIRRTAALGRGDQALVLAAAGGVGSLLIQALIRDGVDVVAAVGSEAKAHAVHERLGVATFVYGRGGWARRDDPRRRFDVLADGIGGDIGEMAADLVRPGGRRIVSGAASGSFAPFGSPGGGGAETVFGLALDGPDDARRLVEDALDRAGQGEWTPWIGNVVPFAEAPEAHRAMEERRVVGKTVLVP